MLFLEPPQSWRSVYVVNTGLKTAKKIEKHWKLTLGPLVSSADVFYKNSLNLDQAWHNIWPDLDPICSTVRWYSWKNFSKKADFEKKKA